MKTRQPARLRPCLEELERRVVPAILTTSTNWSGYAVTAAANSVTDVSGEWTVPKVSGSGTAYSSAWVGIDGFKSSTVEQIGTDSDVVNGTPQYYAWYEMYPSGSVLVPLTIHAGDVISADVSYVGGSSFKLSLTDVTTGQSYTTTQTGSGAQRSSAEWVMEAPSSYFGVLPLANFGSITFQGAKATINGTSGAINNSWSGSQLYQINMVSRFGASEDTTSSLNSSGTGFTVTYTATTSTPPPHRHWWFLFEPDQAASDVTTTSAAAAAAINTLGTGALSIIPQPAPSSFNPAGQQSPVTALSGSTGLTVQAPSPTQAFLPTAALHTDAGDANSGRADATAAPELLPAPGGAGASGERSAPQSNGDGSSTPDGESSPPPAESRSAVESRAWDACFIELSRKFTSVAENRGTVSNGDESSETAAASVAGVVLTLALGGAWRSPPEGRGSRRSRLRLPSTARM